MFTSIGGEQRIVNEEVTLQLQRIIFKWTRTQLNDFQVSKWMNISILLVDTKRAECDTSSFSQKRLNLNLIRSFPLFRSDTEPKPKSTVCPTIYP